MIKNIHLKEEAKQDEENLLNELRSGIKRKTVKFNKKPDTV
jgi:hypothetical protein